MRVPKSGTLLVACATAAIVALGGTPLRAQQAAVIKGRVTAQTGEPLGGANVIVANTNLGAVTAQNGTYTISIGQEAVRGQQVVLTARYIGHKPVARTVTLSQGEQEQNFELSADPLRLEEVVVTGVGEATSLKKLPFAVARVTEEQLQAVPGQSALAAVAGKIAGVRLVPNSAQPGGEPSLRLRGATSISGRQDPLIIVDGVITRFGLLTCRARTSSASRSSKVRRHLRSMDRMRRTASCRCLRSAGATCRKAGCACRAASKRAATTCRAVCNSHIRTRGKSIPPATTSWTRTGRGR